ncbi:MAG: hypothetical protein AUG91_04060 [Actinobacteria bacterium 13_1_20CM_4_69_9]|nr:MAG: hypothetical protein AUG91_04060 [Actinobacteria bacterium 13_1_20CM_4_69_9]
MDHRRQARRPAAISLTWKQVRARRLARGALTERSPSLVDVARRTGGIHAQVQASAELQLASRVEGITQQDVRDALWRERTLVKAWTLRGTLHLHPADELPLWFAARGAVSREIRDLPAWPDPAGVVHPPVSAAEGAKLQSAASSAARPARSGFRASGGPTSPTGERAYSGTRFLHAYGPARPADFREWFGADVPFDLVDVEEVDVEGHRAFVLAGDTEFPELGKSVRLLPEYDVYVMGFREREHLVPERVRAQVAAHGRGRYEGPAGVRFLLVDGVAAGLWERKKSAKRLEVAVTPAGRVNRAALAAEAERFAAFLGVEPVLTVA